MKRIVFDDVFFSISNSGIARYWYNILENISKYDLLPSDIELVVLNRSDKLMDLGFEVVDFPHYDFAHTEVDSFIVGKVCNSLNADLFISSYYSIALGIRNLGVIYDLIPEKFDFNMLSRGWLQRPLSWLYADSFITISENSKRDFLDEYPICKESEVTVLYPGVDLKVFNHKDASISPSQIVGAIASKPYFITVGSRYQQSNYKNGHLIVDAIESSDCFNLNWVMVGGEQPTEEEKQTCIKKGIRIFWHSATDQELKYLLKNATCLIYPSLYEGFGIPPLEALAMGTPVIVSRGSSLSEAVGEYGEFIGGYDAKELEIALLKVQGKEYRARIEMEGPEFASTFSWKPTSELFVDKIVYLLNTAPGEQSSLLDRKFKVHNDVVRNIQA